MHCQFVVPGVIPPSGQREEFLAGLTAPAFSLLLSRGSIVATPGDSYDAWLCQRFGVEKQNDWPLAAITLVADGGDAGTAYWLRADPVHLRVNRDQLILADCSTFDLDKTESTEFTIALNQHFGADGFAFRAHHPTRWYLRLPSAVDLHCTPLQSAAGKNIDTLLPTGSDARRFRSLFNEAQMLLFAHPVNEAREQAGKLPINSIWFWGGGRIPVIKKPMFTEIWTDDHIARSLAMLASIPVAEMPADSSPCLTNGDIGNERLVIFDELQSPQQYGDINGWRNSLAKFEEHWLAPSLGALRSGRMTQLTVICFGDDRSMEIKITRADLWKFWRSARPLADILG